VLSRLAGAKVRTFSEPTKFFGNFLQGKQKNIFTLDDNQDRLCFSIHYYIRVRDKSNTPKRKKTFRHTDVMAFFHHNGNSFNRAKLPSF
jgi:hypothetical protein